MIPKTNRRKVGLDRAAAIDYENQRKRRMEAYLKRKQEAKKTGESDN